MTGQTTRWTTTTVSIAASVLLIVALIAPLPTMAPVFGQAAVVAPTDIVVPAAWETDAAIQLAAGDLRETVADVYGVAPRVRPDDAPVLPPHAIVLLAPGAPLLEQLVRGGALQPESLSDDGFRLLRTNYRGQPVTFVIGGSIRGVAYGAFRFVELMRLDPEVVRRPLDLRAEPKFALRLVSSPTGDNYPPPEQALRWGFNTVQITQWPWLITYEGYDPAILGAPDSEERQWVQANRQRAAEEIARAKALHLQVLAWGDAVSLPRATIDLYGAEVGLRGADRQPIFCLSRPRTQALYTYSLRELLSAFPGIDIVMIRTGENYPAGPIVGNTPDKRECGGDNGDPVKMVRLTMDLSYKQIVEWGGRRYIQRAWDIGQEGFHADPDVASAVLAGWGGKPGLIVSFKHTKTDFWRYNPPNPNLAKQRLTRMV
ncbi:MAG: hypothetical protein NZ518_04785, partial [Dehalococcoidia bacterium]|nr:hypothetical protein [Dehalococcoidia bacterium]